MEKNKKENKSQATIYIIIGILILVLVAIFLLTRNNFVINNQDNPDVKPIYDHVKDCIDHTATSAVVYIGLMGGIYNQSEYSTDLGVTYYFDKGINRMPKKSFIEASLSNYIDKQIITCTNFSIFPDYNINEGKASSVVKIEDDRVIFNVDYPVEISKGSRKYSFSSFNDLEIPIRLGIVYKAANELMDEQMKDQSGNCLSCIFNVTEKYDLHIATYDYSNNTIIFSIIDDNSKANNESYAFVYANRYDSNINDNNKISN